MRVGMSRRRGTLQFRILGPLEVVDAGRSISVGGYRQRALLAVLLLHRNEVVSPDQLIDSLWGEEPPATAGKTLQVYVSQLRKILEYGTRMLLTKHPATP